MQLTIQSLTTPPSDRTINGTEPSLNGVEIPGGRFNTYKVVPATFKFAQFYPSISYKLSIILLIFCHIVNPRQLNHFQPTQQS